jgi:hypothetical protein
MTQRLTPEVERAVRLDDAGYKEVHFPESWVYQRRGLLQEIDALRAELAGAEERGRRRDIADVVAYLRTAADNCAPTSWGRFAANAFRQSADRISRGDHVRTGTTPPDAGEPPP